jgi:hypothetical protein
MMNLPLSRVYQLLEPGPVVLLTTARRGRANIMTLSWHMMVEFEPQLDACVVSNRNYSFSSLRATRECVIAIPALELAPKVVEVGNCSGRNVDKFARFGLTPVPAELVAPPLVAECFANLECKVARCFPRPPLDPIRPSRPGRQQLNADGEFPLVDGVGTVRVRHVRYSPSWLNSADFLKWDRDSASQGSGPRLEDLLRRTNLPP